MTTDQKKGAVDVRPPARLWRAPVWAHLLALAVVLLALAGVVGTSGSFSADEGAAIVQARSLARGDGWVVAHPMPEVDAAGVNYPLELSEHGPRGSAPFGKHPLYALLLAGADGVGGVTAMVLLSLTGTVAAAGLAGALAGRLRPDLTRPAIWVTGLASPLLFDGFLVIAHTLGAALAVAAVLVAVVAFERRRPLLALGVVPLLAACVLLRNEGIFLAAALAAVAGVVFLRRPEVRLVAVVVAVGSTVAGAGAHLFDRWWTSHLLGGRLPIPAGAPSSTAAGDSLGLVASRVQGLRITWLTPGYGGRPLTSLALLVMAGAVAAGAVAVRMRAGDRSRILGCATVAAAAAVLAVAAGPDNVVPGLLVAFPAGLAGLFLVGRRTLASDAARVAAGVAALFIVAVLATQYAKGGGGEWGGRYFALSIPIIVPVLLLALSEARDGLAPAVARRALVALAVCSLALTTMGLGALRSAHQANLRLVAAVDRAGRAAAVAEPVMVTTEGSMPRFAWSTFDRQRWLLTDPAGVGDLLARLSGAGVDRIAFVSRDIGRDRPLLDAAGAHVVSTDGSQSGRRWQILVVELR